MYTVLILAYLLSAYQVSSTILFPRRSILGNLSPRQTADPDQCTDVCDSIDNLVESCFTISCLCTATIEAGVQACVDCFLESEPTPAVIKSAMNLTDTFNEACAGEDVPVVTLPNSSNSSPTKPSTQPSSSEFPPAVVTPEPAPVASPQSTIRPTISTSQTQISPTVPVPTQKSRSRKSSGAVIANTVILALVLMLVLL